MNASTNVQQQISELIAFIILFEKKIQQIRIKLAGNEDFHSKLAFNLFDNSRKNKISGQDILQMLNSYSLSSAISLGQAQLLIQKYSTSVSSCYLTSHQFLLFLSPFTNQSLQNRLLLRNLPKSLTQLSIPLSKLLVQLVSTTIMMLSVTERIKHNIQQANQISFVDMVHFIKSKCSNQRKLFQFVNSKDIQYDFSLDDTCFFVHYFSRCKESDVDQLTDQNIKQLIMPIDLKSHKIQAQSHKTQTLNNFYSGQANNVFANTKAHYFLPSSTVTLLQRNENKQIDKQSTSVNFLSTNYKQTNKNFYKPSFKPSINPTFPTQREFDRLDSLDQNIESHHPTAMIYNRNSKIPQNQNQQDKKQVNMTKKSNQINSVKNTNLFQNNHVNNNVFMIQRFNRQQSNNTNKESIISQVQINKSYKGNQNSFLNFSRNQNVQRFQDDYINNRSQYSDEMSRGSAFLQY